MGNATKSDEVKTGRGHLVGHKSSTQDRYSLKGNQCLCADVKSVFEIMKNNPKYLDTADLVRDVVISRLHSVNQPTD